MKRISDCDCCSDHPQMVSRDAGWFKYLSERAALPYCCRDGEPMYRDGEPNTTGDGVLGALGDATALLGEATP